MKKVTMLATVAAALGLAGCVAVPVYDAPVPYAYGPPAYAPPPAVVLQPTLSLGFGYRGGYHHYYGRYRHL